MVHSESSTTSWRTAILRAESSDGLSTVIMTRSGWRMYAFPGLVELAGVSGHGNANRFVERHANSFL